MPQLALHQRLAPREDIVQQIVAQLNGHTDEAHALIVRPLEDKHFQIISGHHRFLAAKKAKLETVPCWVRKMDDAEAYMALALNNMQGELHPLEVGLHALKSGLSVRDYAERTGISKSAVSQRQTAAEVSTYVDKPKGIADYWRHLCEIHAAPKWLWPALVAKLQAESWTVETTRKNVQSLSETPEPPEWADKERIAEHLIAGTLLPKAIAKFTKSAQCTGTVSRRIKLANQRHALL